MKNILPEWLIVLIILVVGLILWCKGKPDEVEDETKASKQSLADKYSITRPTLKKWIIYFQNELNIEEWTKKRFLSGYEVAALENSLGCDYSLVLNKGQIAERAYSDYKTVSENVTRNLDKIGISLDAWNSCSCFPPSITNRILEVLG